MKVYGVVGHRTVSLVEVQETTGGIWAQSWRTEDLLELGGEGLEGTAFGDRCSHLASPHRWALPVR